MVFVMALLLVTAFIMLGYLFIGMDIYADIELQQMVPKAEAIRQLLLEYIGGSMTSDAFVHMSESFIRAENATVFIVDGKGGVLSLFDSGIGITPNVAVEKLSEQIREVIGGKVVKEDNFKLSGRRGALLVGMPVTNEYGNAIGGVFVIKSIENVNGVVNRMSKSLLWLAIICVVILMLAGSWQASRISAPLRQMADSAMEMANGNFNVRIPGSDEPGETGLLARSLNELCEKLSSTIYQLRTEKSQLNQILYSMSDGVAVVDGLGVLTHCNPALMRMFGVVDVKSREELVDDDSIWEVFDRVYATGVQQMISHRMANGRTLWITISAIIAEDGECTGVVGLFKDMTEMERTEEMRREYVANVSHELRTPLTAIRGLLEPLADGMVNDEETRARYYKTMLHEVMRLSRLITDMMTLTKLQAGTEYMDIARVNMVELLNDIVSSYKNTAEEKGIELKLNAADVPDALTDGDRVEQVIVILLDNAMRYTKPGGSITLGIKDGVRIIVSVSDTGCGISEKDLPHIFDRFYKADKSHKEEGTGLGLSIAHQIMEKLGESIAVTSEQGVGTTFEFTLKKYVTNAIALGPVGEVSLPNSSEPVKNEESVPEKGGKQKSRRTAQDAEYEVVREHDGKTQK